MGWLGQNSPVSIKRRNAERTAYEGFEDRIHNTGSHNKKVQWTRKCIIQSISYLEIFRDKYSRTSSIRTLVIRMANYPDRLRP